MFRIAHISDLHLESRTNPWKPPTVIQNLVRAYGSRAGLEVQADPASPAKLDALKTALRALHADLIVVTGDVTNFGDPEAFSRAAEELGELAALTSGRPSGTGASVPRLLCVPGNHDTLVERWRAIESRTMGRLLLHLGANLFREADRIRRLADQLEKVSPIGPHLPFLSAYGSTIEPQFGSLDPSHPWFVSTDFGEIALFLFNSTDDREFMANQGRIGAGQFNALNRALDDPGQRERLDQAIKVALLHHHPISAPEACGDLVERAYNWMKDGPRFLQYLHRRGFRLVLHGHEHEPYHCAVRYNESEEAGLHIVAAGSTLQRGLVNPGSFNVIDILNPFEARLRRFDYADTGFPTDKPTVEERLALRPLSQVRISGQGEDSTPEDAALQNLVRGEEGVFDETHAYELLEFKVEITALQLYKGVYRRCGSVEGRRKDRGPVFVLTGSPAMRRERMAVVATDELTNKSLDVEWLADRPHRKVVRVLHRTELPPEARFDVSLSFQWQAAETEPNDFDGVNLSTFRHPVGKLRYEVLLPWEPAQFRLCMFGQTLLEAGENVIREKVGGQYRYSFELDNPRHLTYMIWLQPGG